MHQCFYLKCLSVFIHNCSQLMLHKSRRLASDHDTKTASHLPEFPSSKDGIAARRRLVLDMFNTNELADLVPQACTAQDTFQPSHPGHGLLSHSNPVTLVTAYYPLASGSKHSLQENIHSRNTWLGYQTSLRIHAPLSWPTFLPVT